MSISSLIVQPGVREDALDLNTNCFWANRLEQVQQQIERFIDDFARQEAGRLVAEVDGRVVGNGDVIRENHRLKRHRAEWSGVVVSGAYQQQGIARALLHHTLQLLAAWQVDFLTVGVRGGTSAEEVYHRLGLREYSRLNGGSRNFVRVER